jgi:hypothetical protein
MSGYFDWKYISAENVAELEASTDEMNVKRYDIYTPQCKQNINS